MLHTMRRLFITVLAGICCVDGPVTKKLTKGQRERSRAAADVEEPELLPADQLISATFLGFFLPHIPALQMLPLNSRVKFTLSYRRRGPSTLLLVTKFTKSPKTRCDFPTVEHERAERIGAACPRPSETGSLIAAGSSACSSLVVFDQSDH